MSAKDILKSIIINPEGNKNNFHVEDFIRFFRAKNNQLRYPNTKIDYLDDKDLESNFVNGKKLAEGKLNDGELIVCSFLVNKELTERSGKKAQYNLGKKILKTEQADAGIFIFYDLQGNFRFSLIYTNYLGKRRDWSDFKRFTYYVSPELTNKTFLNQIGESDFSTLEKIKEAFSIEKVTQEFFDEFIKLFNKIKDYLINQNLCDIETTHNFTQQLLNRILFLYFVQKKKWLGNNKNFLRDFWRIYNENFNDKNEFYEKWLKVLFLETFNNKFVPRKYLPKELNEILMLAPYLNGGLFEPNKLDDISFKIEDIWFEQIFEFFERYNFTIDENSDNDVDLEVDPKFIGDIYESLVQGENGVFYTDRVEIDFMSRRSLVEYFYNHLTADKISKDLIYKFIFSKTDEEIAEVEEEFNKLKIWKRIEELLNNLTVLDPACGSGSFLVGMLKILTTLYKVTYKNLNKNIDDFEIKKQIIGRSLYGVDVMEWACHIAELRLWLQLIVEADLKLEELKFKPLLPNLTFKIRPGDSLVQEIGGINLSLKSNIHISPYLKKKLTELKQEKLKFFNNDPSRKFKTEEALLNEELRIFGLILEERILNIDNKIKFLQNSPKQDMLFKEDEFKKVSSQELKKTKQDFNEKIKEEIDKLKAERQNLVEILSNLNKTTKPFVWDIDFVEIFSEEGKGGFDIVIGNPPYIRQEEISDPKIPKDKITNENKREYKEKLVKSVQQKFFVKLNKKSDLYIYFYFHGLSLLNEKGVFCFITSNSWLDVEYGKELQEFLLNNNKIFAIYDNLIKRSFKADVNTVIALFSSSDKSKENENLQHIVKFVMFKKPFEEVINVQNLLKIENTNSILTTDDFRVYPKKQIELIKEGWEYPEDLSEEQQKVFDFKIGKYTGNKWGGKYLRAPDIYFTILEKGKGKLVKLGDIAKVKRGFTTGANEFFYLDEKKIKEWGIEKEFLKPVIKSPKECKSILIDPKDLKYKVFMCHKSKKELKGTNALKYIEWGEQKEFHKKPTCNIRNHWYSLPVKNKSQIFIIPIINDFIRTAVNGEGDDDIVFNSDVVLNVYYKDKITLGTALNSTLTQLFAEIGGRKSLGGGALKLQIYEASEIYTINTKKINKEYINRLKTIFQKLKKREIKNIFEECGFNPNLPIREQEANPLPDRKELDDIIFDILDLTEQERKEVYWAVCELVKNRLEKAKSV